MSQIGKCLKEYGKVRRSQAMREFLTRPAQPVTPSPTIKVRDPYLLPDIDNCIVRHEEWATVNEKPYLDAIDMVLRGNEIGYKVSKVNQGVSMIRFALVLNEYKDYKKALRLTNEMQAAMNNPNVVITQEGAIISIEIPCHINTLRLGDVLNNPEYHDLTVSIGQSIKGDYVLQDIDKLTHVLVAGASGSGKSVFVQSVILSLLCKNTPKDIELYMIDPKKVEFQFYNPLVQCHVYSQTSEAIAILKKLNDLMDVRYTELARVGCRDIDSFNEKFPENKLRRIVLVVDELADLMMTSRKQAEEYIVRLAQKSRACGIHMIIATQYPKKEVVTGLLKANIPTKVCFAVTSPTASCVMLGRGGAEKLIGKGDMYFQTEKDINPLRIQGAFVEEREIINVVGSLLRNQEVINYV